MALITDHLGRRRIIKKLSLIAIVTVSVALFFFFTPDAWAPTADDCSVTGGGMGFYENLTQEFYAFGGKVLSDGENGELLGEWTHRQISGSSGKFTFHAGTKSAPPETGIFEILCLDPGSCDPARPAPNKQVQFFGIGEFKNLGSGGPSANVITPLFNGATLHCFEVLIADLGEPGISDDPSSCVPVSPEVPADCACHDFYSIKIYNNTICSTPIYDVQGYISGGNLQIAPPLPSQAP